MSFDIKNDSSTSPSEKKSPAKNTPEWKKEVDRWKPNPRLGDLKKMDGEWFRHRIVTQITPYDGEADGRDETGRFSKYAYEARLKEHAMGDTHGQISVVCQGNAKEELIDKLGKERNITVTVEDVESDLDSYLIGMGIVVNRARSISGEITPLVTSKDLGLEEYTPGGAPYTPPKLEIPEQEKKTQEKPLQRPELSELIEELTRFFQEEEKIGKNLQKESKETSDLLLPIGIRLHKIPPLPRPKEQSLEDRDKYLDSIADWITKGRVEVELQEDWKKSKKSYVFAKVKMVSRTDLHPEDKATEPLNLGEEVCFSLRNLFELLKEQKRKREEKIKK